MNQAAFDRIKTCIDAVKSTGLDGYNININDYSDRFVFEISWKKEGTSA